MTSNIMTKHIRLDAMPGDLINDAMDAAIERASVERVTVKLEFNGVDIVAYPTDSRRDVENRYAAERAKIQKESAAGRTERLVDKRLTSVLLVINQNDWTHAQLREALAE
jgi:hypothetical protein